MQLGTLLVVSSLSINLLTLLAGVLLFFWVVRRQDRPRLEVKEGKLRKWDSKRASQVPPEQYLSWGLLTVVLRNVGNYSIQVSCCLTGRRDSFVATDICGWRESMHKFYKPRNGWLILEPKSGWFGFNICGWDVLEYWRSVVEETGTLGRKNLVPYVSIYVSGSGKRGLQIPKKGVFMLLDRLNADDVKQRQGGR